MLKNPHFFQKMIIGVLFENGKRINFIENYIMRRNTILVATMAIATIGTTTQSCVALAT